MFHDNFSVLFRYFLFHLGKEKSTLSKVSFTVTSWCVWHFFHTFCSSDPVGLLLSILLCRSKADGITVFHISHILPRV